MIRTLLRLAFLALAGVVAVSLGAAVRVRRTFVPVDDPDADEIALIATFAPLAFRSRARAFRGGEIEVWFGGGVVDLRGATLAPEGAHLRIRSVFGGGQLVVPETWSVELDVRGMGGVDDSRGMTPAAADAPVLAVEAMTMFGGFQLVSEVSDEVERELAAEFGR